MQKGGKKIINNEKKKILPVLLSSCMKSYTNGSLPFKFLISLFLHSLPPHIHIKRFFEIALWQTHCDL